MGFEELRKMITQFWKFIVASATFIGLLTLQALTLYITWGFVDYKPAAFAPLLLEVLAFSLVPVIKLKKASEEVKILIPIFVFVIPGLLVISLTQASERAAEAAKELATTYASVGAAGFAVLTFLVTLALAVVMSSEGGISAQGIAVTYSSLYTLAAAVAPDLIRALSIPAAVAMGVAGTPFFSLTAGAAAVLYFVGGVVYLLIFLFIMTAMTSAA